MSEEKKKSNAPWILGVTGFVISIPSVLCALLCSAAAAGASGSTSVGILPLLPTFVSLICFILSFYGKSKHSKATGVIMLLLSAILVVLGIVFFSIWSLGAAGCYFAASFCSILNANRPA